MQGGEAACHAHVGNGSTTEAPESGASGGHVSERSTTPRRRQSWHMSTSSAGLSKMSESQDVLPFQSQVRVCYRSVQVQVVVAGLIVANFVTNMIEMQIDPDQVKYSGVFRSLDHVWNAMFTMELAVNMYAHWFVRFWEAWNVFDVVVVTIGILLSSHAPLPHAFGMLRTIRAFRVLRLFRRVNALNKILSALVRAMAGVFTTFLFMWISMSIYALFAVELFKDIGAECTETGEYVTARGECFGREYFGDYGKAMYSLFQVLTGESWSEAIARTTIWGFDTPMANFAAALYYVSFILINVFVICNVVVTVLLDKMQEPQTGDQQAATQGDVKAITEQLKETKAELAALRKDLLDALRTPRDVMDTPLEKVAPKQNGTLVERETSV